MALVTKTDADGDPNPCFDVNPKFDDVQCTGRGTAAPNRDPRGLHPQRLRGCRREARDRPRPDGRQPDDVRGLRPRLRAAVVRSQREQGADRRDGQRGIAARGDASASNCSAIATPSRHELPRRHGGEHRHHEGVLGRRDDPDLHQPRPPQSSANPTFPTYEEVRTAGPRRLPEPDRPREPGQAGDPQDHEQGGAAERRRLRLAPSEPERRCRGRHAAAVPVRRGDGERDDRPVALLRPARLPARHGRSEEQHQHARDLRCGRPGNREEEESRISGQSTSPRRSRS